MKAIWNGTVIAESDETVLVEGNHYFPLSALSTKYVEASAHRTQCHWKGTAHYYTLRVNGAENRDAVWYYPSPKGGAEQVKDRVAFWKGVEIAA